MQRTSRGTNVEYSTFCVIPEVYSNGCDFLYIYLHVCALKHLIRMKLKLPLLSDLEIYGFERKNFVSVNCFFETLKKLRNDSDRALRKNNFIACYKDEIQSVEEVKYCPLSAVIKYCYMQRQRHLGCSKICQQIERLILYHDDKNDTTLDLYNQIAKFDLKNCFKLQSRAYDHPDMDENSIPTLVKDYKGLFSEKHWKRVLLFEWHFYVLYGNECNDNELPQKKREYFDFLQHTVRASCDDNDVSVDTDTVPHDDNIVETEIKAVDTASDAVNAMNTVISSRDNNDDSMTSMKYGYGLKLDNIDHVALSSTPKTEDSSTTDIDSANHLTIKTPPNMDNKNCAAMPQALKADNNGIVTKGDNNGNATKPNNNGNATKANNGNATNVTSNTDNAVDSGIETRSIASGSSLDIKVMPNADNTNDAVMFMTLQTDNCESATKPSTGNAVVSGLETAAIASPNNRVIKTSPDADYMDEPDAPIRYIVNIVNTDRPVIKEERNASNIDDTVVITTPNTDKRVLNVPVNIDHSVIEPTSNTDRRDLVENSDYNEHDAKVIVEPNTSNIDHTVLTIKPETDYASWQRWNHHHVTGKLMFSSCISYRFLQGRVPYSGIKVLNLQFSAI